MNLDLGIGDYSSLYSLANHVRNLASQIQAAWTEEHRTGDWTPALAGASGGSATYSIQNGHWIKLAPGLVYAQAYIQVATVGTLSGQLFITGLPFVVKAGLNDEAPAFVQWHGMTTAYVNIAGSALQATTSIQLNGIGAASTSIFSSAVQASDLAAGCILKVSLVYRTNS